MIIAHYRNRDHFFLETLIGSFRIFCWIMILLHYLGSLWIFVGSETFANVEEGHVPWSMDNDDFKGMTIVSQFAFATYWVCTIVTTVGYGDYTGGTTLEYAVSLFFMFFGFGIFAVVQVQVIKLMTIMKKFDDYNSEDDV